MSDAFTLKGSINVDLSSVIKDLDKLGNTVDGVGRKTDTLGGKMGALGSKMSKVGSTLTKRVTLPFVGLGTASFKMASDVNESMNKVQAVFGDGAKVIDDFSKTTLKSLGISRNASLDMMATFGDMGDSMGLTEQKTIEMSKGLTQLTGDLASFKNVSIDRAQTALTSIYTGETESLKSLGIVMTQANLQEFALSKGIDKKVNSMSQAELVGLRYNYVMEKSSNAIGDFAKTSDSASNQMRAFPEALKELGATMGEKLLPLITPIITKVNDMVISFSEMDSGTQTVILAFGGFAAVIGPLIALLGGFITNSISLYRNIKLIITKMKALNLVTKMQTVSQKALNFVMSINPIVLVITLITALVGAIIYLWNTNEGFRNALIETWQKITDVFTQFNEFLTGVFQTDWTESFGALGNIFNAFFKNIENYWNSIKRIFSGIITFVSGVFSGEWGKAWEGVSNIFGGIMDGLEALIKAPLNGIIGLINFAIDGLNKIKIPEIDIPFYGTAGGWGFSIPRMNYLENGGVLTKPTMIAPFTMAGERDKGRSAQAEAVIPLDRLFKEVREMVRQELNITMPLTVDGKLLTRLAVAPHQQELENYNKLRYV